MAQGICKVCKREFYVKPSHVLRGWGKYCSKKCQSSSQFTGAWLACHRCGMKVYRTPRDVSRSKSRRFFCTKSCQTIWRNSVLYTGKNHANWRGGESTYRDVLHRAKVDKRCQLCKTEDERVLIVHHIDKNRKNNTLKNLIWLCANCHMLIHNHGVKI
jgi:hypothetical protein